ncbi:Ig-like domain-containing protein, partial [Rahnella bruchi]|uniref:Ig-like domain-containing protein n=1 Tax=Rahnella bruchi TaxID=1510573 RepID=UPI0039EFBA9A
MGEWTFTATASNEVGISAVSEGYSVESVASNGDAFTAPVITSLTDDVGLHQGDVHNGGTTDDTAPGLHGTGEPGSIITITMDGPVTQKLHHIAQVEVGKDGTWSYQFTGKQALQKGDNVFHVTASDSVDHMATGSDFVVTLTGSNHDDITPPDAPVITDVYDDVGVQQGPVADGGKTDDSLLLISGTAAAGSIIKISHVYEVTGAVYTDGSAVADANGHWTFQMTGELQPSYGNRIFTATATDAAGNVSAASDGYVVNYVASNQDEITPIDAPTIDMVKDNVAGHNNATGPLNNGDVTNDSHPALSGHATAGAIVNIYDNGILLGSVTASARGGWKYTPTTLADGEHDLTASVVTSAGESAPSTAFTITVDTVAEKPVIDSVMDNEGLKTGEITDGGLTDDSRPILTGHAEAGATVRIHVYENGKEIYGEPVLANADGIWTYQPKAFTGHGKTYSFGLTSVDKAGNYYQLDGEQFNVKYVLSNEDGTTPDTTPPAQPVIDTYHDNVGTATGDFKGGTTTDDTTPTLNGHAEANSVVRVYDGSTLLGSVIAGSDGAWNFKSPARADGEHSFHITATDAAGNISVQSADFVVNVVSESITLVTPTIDYYHGDTGGSFGSGTYTDNHEPTLEGHAEAGSIVRVYIDNGSDGSVVADADGHWQYTPNHKLSHTHIFTVDSTLQGNLSNTSEKFVINIDPPPLPLAITNMIDDQGSTTGNVANNGNTDDSRLKIEGTAANGSVVVISHVVQMTGNTYIDGSVVADTHGHWTFQMTGPFQPWLGNRIFTATANGEESNHYTVNYVESDTDGALQTTLHSVATTSMLTSSDASNHHPILTLAQVDDSHKSTAAVDITDHVQNTLHLTLNDILSEAHANLFIQDGHKQLAITGDQGDVVELKVEDLAHNTWQDAGQVTSGGIQYEVYQHTGGDVELLVQHGLELHQV